MKTITGIAVALSLTSIQAVDAEIVQSDALPQGVTVDLSVLPTNSPLAADDAAFRAAGIQSIRVDNRPSTNSEYYDGGIFGAGRALFGTESGELIALDQGFTPDYGSPTFTIDFSQRVDAFGMRIADTSQFYATPQIDFFRDEQLIESIVLSESYDARTAFGFSSAIGFDRVVINTDIDGSGFGFDGVGITDLTTSVPEPASLSMLAMGSLLLRRRRR
ncbi:MAG: PEP-CTERM sorting domain-containing protein [Phycisphaeraceae bacterium]